MIFPGKTIHASVIVPVFNAERYLRQCLESLAQIDYPEEHFEIICVDNGSSDSSPGILAEFAGRIRTIQESTRGAGAARNAGVRAASGSLLAFTDADCMVHPEWLRQLLVPLEGGKAGAVGGRILARSEAGTIESFGEIVHDHARAIESSGYPPYLISANFAVVREVFERCGGFDVRWLRSQDSELSFRLLQGGCKFVYAAEAIVYHHNRSTLRQLCREAFLHGYYGAELFRVYAALVDGYRQRREAAPHTPEEPPAESTIPSWKRVALARVFQGVKRIGWSVGSWHPPLSLRTPARRAFSE